MLPKSFNPYIAHITIQPIYSPIAHCWRRLLHQAGVRFIIVMLYVGEEKTMIEVATGTVSAMVLLAKEGRYL